MDTSSPDEDISSLILRLNPGSPVMFSSERGGAHDIYQDRMNKIDRLELSALNIIQET